MIPLPQTAMILAAGLGTRMRPLTDTCPKPLIKVGDKTLLDYNLDLLVKAGIDRAVVNCHYLSHQIHNFVRQSSHPSITVSDETERLLDSGGGIKRALPLLGDHPFFVMNADSFFINGPRDNLHRLAAYFDPDRMDIVLMVAAGLQITGYDGLGDFIMDADGHLMRRKEREVAPFVYTGVALIKPDLFADTPDDPFSLNLIFTRAVEARRLFGLRLDGEWLHVGTPDAIDAAEERLGRGRL